jgi:putative DNA primase/helicase
MACAGRGRSAAMADFWANNPDLADDAERLIRQHEDSREKRAGIIGTAPPFGLPSATIAEVRGNIGHGIADFLAHRGDATSPRVLLAGPTGSGKTEMVGRQLPRLIEDDKAEGRPYRVIIMVPAHRLGDQICARYQALGVNAAVYRGRGDPFDGGSTSELCQNMTEVRLAVIAQEEVATAVCDNTKRKTRCPFRDGCKYYEQLDRAIAADCIFIAHNFIFQAVPEQLFANVGTIIIEEDFTPHGVGSVEDLAIGTFDQVHLNRHPVLHGKKHLHEVNYSATADLALLYRKIERALTMAASEESSLRDAINVVGLTADDIKTARVLTWQRKYPSGMYPAMPLTMREAIAQKATHHLTLPRIATVLHALEDLANRAEAPDLLEPDDSIGNGAFSFKAGLLTVHRLKKPDQWLDDLPILIPSASARPDLVPRFFPGIEIVAPLPPALPFQTVHQRLGAFGKEATQKKLAELVAEVRLKSAGKKALVIVHMEHEHAFSRIPGVHTLHHGDVAGDDDFGDVDIVFHIGGPFARPSQIARQASAEAGQLVEKAKPVRTPCVGLLADGSGVRFQRLAYEDTRLQTVHAGIYDQSFVQGGLGRGRGINRSASTPLEIWIYGNVPLPVPVTTIERWRPLGGIEKMVLAGRVYSNAHDMARFYPEVFPSWEAAAHVNRRWADIGTAAHDLIAGLPEAWVRVIWQPNGQGHKRRYALAPRSTVNTLRGEILHEFPDGFATWAVAPFTPGAGRRRPLEESAYSGKEISFPEYADSSPTILGLGGEPERGGPPAWPPDG